MLIRPPSLASLGWVTTENENAAEDTSRGAAEAAAAPAGSAPFNLVAAITVGEDADTSRPDQAMTLETAEFDAVGQEAEWTVVNWVDADEAESPGETESAGANRPAAEGDSNHSTEASAAQPRDLHLGKQTAEGLATMTPVAMQTAAAERDYGDTILQINDVSKSFGAKRALSEVSYGVRQGSFSGLVGPNGAGKTTLLNIISGLLPPSKGTVTVAGVDVWKSRREAARRIGVLPDRLRMFEHLTGAQYLAYVGSIRGLNRAQTLERTEALIDQFELRSSANRLVTDYSAGMRKKLALAATLIHSPQLLVLDEPFETIDPVSAGVLIDVLIDYADRGGTVLLSSHSMDLVQRTCDHVVVIAGGEVLAEGTVDEVRDGITLEERFRSLVRGPEQSTGLDWLEISFG